MFYNDGALVQRIVLQSNMGNPTFRFPGGDEQAPVWVLAAALMHEGVRRNIGDDDRRHLSPN